MRDFSASSDGVASFDHEALFYRDTADFLAGTEPFIREGLDADEPVLVVVSESKIDMLRDVLGRDREQVQFADMAEVGRNPARIIPAWRDFLTEHGPGRRSARGVGEPIWAARSPAEMIECHYHESLLNVAFSEGSPLHLLCPYDTSALGEDVLSTACSNHHAVVDGQQVSACETFQIPATASDLFIDALPEPHGPVGQLAFDADGLGAVRDLVYRHATESGVDEPRTSDLVLAVDEIAVNSVLYGGGGGLLRLWRDDTSLICEVRDQGSIVDPLVGRTRPAPESARGRGLWIVNQLCDLVQIRTSPSETAVRLHLTLP